MLRSEIHELEKFVDPILSGKIGDAAGQPDITVEQLDGVRSICAGLRVKWTRELFSNVKEPILKRYVEYHQAGIIRLSDRVSRTIFDLQPSAIEVRSPLLYEVNVELETLITFFRHHFYLYFDHDHPATRHYSGLVGKKINELGREINLQPQIAIEPSLIDCITISVNDLMALALYEGLSYRQAGQCLRIMEMTCQLLIPVMNTTTEELTRALFRQNLNSLHFYHWSQAYFLKKLSGVPIQKKRDHAINELITSYSGISVRPENALHPELASVDELIVGWLREQLRTQRKDQSGSKQVQQLPLNISVPQFALFIRLFYKAGCFPLENIAMITRFFTEHFTTKKQSHISRKSFGRAFYNIDQSAAAIVRDLLQKMLNYLNKTYFP